MCRFTRSGLAAFRDLRPLHRSGSRQGGHGRVVPVCFRHPHCRRRRRGDGIQRSAHGSPPGRHGIDQAKPEMEHRRGGGHEMGFGGTEDLAFRSRQLQLRQDCGDHGRTANQLPGQVCQEHQSRAPAYFIIGIQLSGAEAVALGARPSRDKKAGQRNAHRTQPQVAQGRAPTLKLSTALLLKIEADHLNRYRLRDHGHRVGQAYAWPGKPS